MTSNGSQSSNGWLSLLVRRFTGRNFSENLQMYQFLMHLRSNFAIQRNNMTERERKEMEWWLDELMARSQADKYLELFPEMNDRLWKYAVGVHIWIISGDIDISNPADISRVRNILKTIGSTSAFDYFDNVFNECTPKEVLEILRKQTYM